FAVCGKNEVIKLPCLCSQHLGGFWNIGAGASLNCVLTIAAVPPYTFLGFFQILSMIEMTFRISGESNFSRPATQSSYFCGGCVRNKIASIQSVAGQPVAAPEPIPIHHAVSPSWAIWSVSAIISSHVVGIL